MIIRVPLLSIGVIITVLGHASCQQEAPKPTPSSLSLAWASAYERASTSLAQLSNEDKVGLVTGIGWTGGPCVGNTDPAPAIGFPSLCLQDGPLGLRFAEGVTAFPAGATAGSTWDRKLIRQRAIAMAEEARALGVHVLLGPVAGALGKIPAAGRNWEGFSNDPYLAGIAMQESVEGIQSVGVQACAKHVIGNEQERNRDTISANIDDRTMHELYMWPFADAVHANVAALMCSYNKVNGTWACESDAVMMGLVKEGLDFPGYILSDWDAQHTTVGSANAGLDMAMPGNSFNNLSRFLWGDNLLDAIPDEVPQTRLDDMIRRILASWYYVGQDEAYPPTVIDSWQISNPDVQSNHSEVARKVAREGIVLLKNDNGALPLRKPGSIAIVGEDAITNPDGPNACPDRGCNVGTLGMGWGSGTVQYPYLISPLDGIRARVADENEICIEIDKHTQIITSASNDTVLAAEVAALADIAIVFINANSGEAYITVDGAAGDRVDLDPWYGGNELVDAVAQANDNTIVVVHSVGPIILEQILRNDGVRAIVWANLPGQESGSSLAEVLFGDVSPSGKLPYTIAMAEGDYAADIVPGQEDDFDEGLFVDYRYFDREEIIVRYEFGFGLSYTTFTYTNLTVTPASPVHADLYSTIATVTATITNTGTTFPGSEVAQLYIAMPASLAISGIEFPPRQLRGFAKTAVLQPGRSETVEFLLRRKDVSYWSVERQEFVLPGTEMDMDMDMGRVEIGVVVGASSRDARLEGVLYV